MPFKGQSAVKNAVLRAEVASVAPGSDTIGG
jgi:hypothetical protein